MTAPAPTPTAAPPGHRTAQWIAGRWQDSAAPGTIAVTNPATGEVIGSVPAGGAADVDRAVAAATAAWPAWAALPVAERIAALDRLATLLEHEADTLALLLSRETGMPRHLVRGVQIESALGMLRAAGRVAADYEFRRRVGEALVLREPIGVVAAIIPWNVPLLMAVQKIASALVVGCTVVVKPSELAPLGVLRLAELTAEAGLPAGVVNMVSGHGTVAGTALAAHPDVAMVSLTGSVRAGRSVSEVAAATVKRVHLELGGKSASIVLDDADLAEAVDATVRHVAFNAGQTCFAWSRLLVPAARYEEAVAVAAATADSLRVGDPLDPATELGPLISAEALERVRDHVASGIAEGARLVAGGTEEVPEAGPGHYIRPTVLADVRNSMRIAQEETFGPVVLLIPYQDEDDAVRIANDSVYGLHGAVWSASVERAVAVAGRLRTGQVDVNGPSFNINVPFGGYKQSGNGRELGRWGLDSFTELKAVQWGGAREGIRIGAS
ncbi:MAG TPA: aldehyde dehydrogenase family protein [Thermobifida alba]|nr:aldehyde dehydrogenase family protein [Thermobifida alba]